MLDVAVIRQNDKELGISIPALLDALLFYSHVHLILDRGGIAGALRQIGPRRFRDLLALPNVTVEMTPQTSGIFNETVNGRRMHKPIFASAMDKVGDSQLEQLHLLMSRIDGYPAPSKDFVRKLASRRRISDYDKILGGVEHYDRLYYSLASDPDTLALVISMLAERRGQLLPGGISSDLQIRTHRENEWIFFESRIPIEQVIEKDHPEEELWGTIASELHEYAIDMYISQTNSADVIIKPYTAQIAKSRIDLSLMRAAESAKKIEAFSDTVLERGSIISSALESGELDFDKAIALVRRAEKLRHWVKGLSPSADLLAEYYGEISRESALSTIPARSMRYAFITGGSIAAGLASPLAGIAASLGLGFFDTFVLDGLARGWRPNSFFESVKKTIKEAP